ncbi:serine-enriched protein-like isoform X2 [Dreissena polymorpha]|uniref:BTB domain-containing protein n=2 Tax=Dreissena polymorpha TaxID=45954 RepID=A0A9D3YXW0_DREPO|nr:serine-enriched protein-like isoform X2 [Dreissena polymorpha]XP_052249454.1 serine-enriched protein-like isoform X2 [Dreissena polymorpha]KAH3706439.1 hypothetical protein DPMN_065825 [Dreissena polymorpha]
MDNDQRVPLLEQSFDLRYINPGFQDDCDDTSSGYCSSDYSDTQSLTSNESITSFWSSTSRNKRGNRMTSSDEEQHMKFQTAHALCESMKLIIEMPEMCDLTFLVGPRDVHVYGVRAIMATRSRIFYDLIRKHMSIKNSEEKVQSKKGKSKDTAPAGISWPSSEKLVIPVRKYDAEVFRLLVQFVHCGTVNINEDTVVGLFCGASQFDLRDLQRACLDFLERCVKLGRTEKILRQGHGYNQHSAARKILDKVYSIRSELRQQTFV